MHAARAKERLQADLDCINNEVTAWSWNDQDPRADCTNSAKAIRNTLSSAILTLRNRVANTSQSDRGDQIRALRDIERELGAVRATWLHLRARIDARIVPAFGELLLAADELVWSVHRGAMLRARPGAEPPVPLVWLNPEWGAEMVPIPRIELSTRGTPAAAAEAILTKLGIREIRLPWSALSEPWLLALILHEAAHAVEFDLLPGGELVRSFASEFAKVVGGANSALWGAWATEIFADACAVASGGTTVLSTLVSWETTAKSKLASSSTLPDRYPPPLVRWELMRAYCKQLALPVGTRPSLADEVVADQGIQALLNELPAVVAALERPLPGLELRISELWPETADLFEERVSQKEQDLNAGDLAHDGTMAGVRAALIAAVRAADQGPPDGVAYAAWRTDLCSRVMKQLRACHGPGVRGGGHAFAVDEAGELLLELAVSAREKADRA